MRLQTRYNAGDFQNSGSDWAEIVVDLEDGFPPFEVIRARPVRTEEKYEVEHCIYQAGGGWVWTSGSPLWSVSKFHQFLETADRVVRMLDYTATEGRIGRRDILAAIADEWESVLFS
jgi:hypothetical protein